MLKNTLLSKTEDIAIKKYVKPVLTGVGFGLAVSIVLLLLFSVVVSSSNVPHSIINVLTFISMILGSFVSGFVTARIIRKNGLVMGLVTGICTFLILIICSLFVVPESFSILVFVKGIVTILCACFGGVLGVNYTKRR